MKCPRRFWAWPWELRARGVLGINERNCRYIGELNPRRFYPRVDDKSQTKAICAAAGIPCPATRALVEHFGQIARLEPLLAQLGQFVIKPARGAGGRGVVVIAGREGSTFTTAGGESLSAADLREHVAEVLSGMFSLGGRPDKAIIEDRIEPHPFLAELSAGGTPDLRLVVRQGRPLAAMLRLGTRASRGRANLHQGGIGVGVDIATGQTTAGVQGNRTITRHPDNARELAGLALPHWDESVAMALALSEALEMGYVGVDIVLDQHRGPMVLEANARPGLAIQIANRVGLGLAGPPAGPRPRHSA